MKGGIVSMLYGGAAQDLAPATSSGSRSPAARTPATAATPAPRTARHRRHAHRGAPPLRPALQRTMGIEIFHDIDPIAVGKA